MVKIDKGIPLPPRRRGGGAGRTGRAPIYPWREMEIGDSFFLPDIEPHLISSLAAGAAQRTGRKFATRIEGDGVRVWRIR